MKKYLVISMMFMLMLLTACSPQPLQTIGSDKYYVQVHGDGEEQTEKDITRYEYTLKGFDKDGKSKVLTFTAGNQLKKNAYLQIYYKQDEVITYEEVEEVPKKALKLLKTNNDS